MATVTLVRAAAQDARGIHTMTAMPIDVDLQDLRGGAIQFICSNTRASLVGANLVRITYDAAHGSGHEDIQVGSILG
jgi:hypothetical protein